MKRVLVQLLMALTLAACGGGGGGSPSSSSASLGTSKIAGEASLALGTAPVVSGAPNVVAVTVDGGPAATNSFNSLFTTVTVCQPGSTLQCQTIDHVLVDTGSTGLRILSSVLSSSMQLNTVQNSVGSTVVDCANFVDGSFAWGPLALADVRMGGEIVSSTPVQVVGASAYDQSAGSCGAAANAIKAVADLGAKGILGVGLFQQDCGAMCDPAGNNVVQNGMYFQCSNVACSAVTGTTLASSKQLQQPVGAFAVDNNGLAVILGAVSPGGQTSLNGTLVFGVGTQSNNQFPGLKTLTADGLGNITTQIPNPSLGITASLTSSYLDTGSNALFFDSSIAQCTGINAGFYCPVATANATATLTGANSSNQSVAFSIANAGTLLTTNYSVLPALGGPAGDSKTFDWGLPMFYGRTVVIGIEGRSSTLGIGPFFAL